jgi:pimeloyl-ACP methyl ester carboxylesterase
MNKFQRKTFKTSDGAELSYINAGQGKAIILIHGWSQSAEQFKYQISALAEQYHVVAIDLRGHGQSEKVNYGYRISRLSKDIQELIDVLQLEKPHLLGIQWDVLSSGVISIYLDQMQLID